MKALYRIVLPVLAIAMALGCGAASEESSWAQWRGDDGQGLAEGTGLPVHWAEDGTGVRWSQEVSLGTSSPIVRDGQVFVTTVAPVGKQVELRLESLDLASGEILWQTPVVTRKRERMHRMNTSAGPTPVTDGRLVFAYYGSHLAALDLEGELQWVQEVDPAYLREARYGAGSSPVLFGDLVIILRERERVADELIGWMAAFDKSTGEKVWEEKWDDSCCSYVTPILVPGDNGPELFLVLAGYSAFHDPLTGKRLRRIDHLIAQPVASPVLEGDLLCLASGAHSIRQARCFEKSEVDGKIDWNLLWKYARWVGDTASPVLIDGRFYVLTERGVLRCLDARTGDRIWQKRLERAGYQASLVAGEGKLYAIGQTGVITVLSTEGEILAVNKLPFATYVASPALTEDCLLVRSDSHLHCIEGSGEPAA